jgi:uncharacterized Zn-binding protein involved in type VI secretion
MSVIMTALSQTVHNAVAPMEGLVSDPAAALTNPARAVQQVAGTISAVAALPTELVNTGLAAITAPIAAVLPSFPAAHLGSLYVGAPHAHAHPPSLIPPAPPVPLPSMGSVTLGTCLQVLVGGVPAARAGDLGLAPTCGGFAPFFTIFLGSSNVFIGGMRAARMTDMCTACTPGNTAAVRGAATALKAIAAAGRIAQIAGIVADATDALTAPDPHVAAASGISAAMQAAQMAADAAAAALSATMGTDPAIPPSLPGAIMLGKPNVLIGGAPLPNTADLAQMLLKKIKGRRAQIAFAVAFQVGGGAGCAG